MTPRDKAAAQQQERVRQAKFQSLITQRAQNFPNESYDDRYYSVMTSDEGKQLFAQMKRSEAEEQNLTNETSAEEFDPALKAKAEQEFHDLVERLKLEGHHHDAFMHASGVHPIGKKLYATWQRQALLEKQQNLVRQQRARGGSGGIGLTSALRN